MYEDSPHHDIHNIQNSLYYEDYFESRILLSGLLWIMNFGVFSCVRTSVCVLITIFKYFFGQEKPTIFTVIQYLSQIHITSWSDVRFKKLPGTSIIGSISEASLV